MKFRRQQGFSLAMVAGKLKPPKPGTHVLKLYFLARFQVFGFS
jgi:hypothetical protein